MDEDRLKHSIAVARKMIEIGRRYNLNEFELQELFVLGFNHVNMEIIQIMHI